MRAVPTAKVMVLTALSDVDHIIRALESGAVGYLLKDAPASEVIAGVRAAMAGECDPQAAIEELGKRRGDLLSERDVELLRLTITGRVPADGTLTAELIALLPAHRRARRRGRRPLGAPARRGLA